MVCDVCVKWEDSKDGKDKKDKKEKDKKEDSAGGRSIAVKLWQNPMPLVGAEWSGMDDHSTNKKCRLWNKMKGYVYRHQQSEL